mgnify:CR=1 FL=1
MYVMRLTCCYSSYAALNFSQIQSIFFMQWRAAHLPHAQKANSEE